MKNSILKTTRLLKNPETEGRRLKFRFILIVTLLLIITMSLVAVFSINRERRIIIESVLQKSKIAAQTLARAASDILPESVQNLNDIGRIILNDPDLISLSISKRGGFFENSRAAFNIFKLTSSTPVPERETATAGEKFISYKEIFEMKYYFNLGNILYLYVPFKFKDNSGGEVCLEMLLTSTQKEINEMLKQHLILTILVTIFGSFISIFLAQFVLTPLNLLVQSTKQIADGAYDFRISENGGEVSYFSSIFNEMAEKLEKKEEFEKRMRNLDKLATIGQLAAGIAHEIKNPLTSIRSLVELIKDDERVNIENKKAVEIIISEVDRLTRVTNEFVSLSKPHKELNFSFFGVNSVLNDTLMLLGPQLKKNRISVFTNLKSKIPIFANHDELAQVFLNIIINSMQAFEADKKNRNIIINTADGADDMCVIEIIDNGCGIEKEDIARICMPFFTRKKSGTGLGLSIVKRILDELKARFQIESVVGQGMAFKISIPIKTDYNKSIKNDE